VTPLFKKKGFDENNAAVYRPIGFSWHFCIACSYVCICFFMLLDEGATIDVARDALSIIPHIVRKFPAGLLLQDLPAAFEVRSVYIIVF
jgi:hypothetical protein